MTHQAYLHKEADQSSLRCTCGNWVGKHLFDLDGHARHVQATRPAYRAMRHVIAGWAGTAQKLAFTQTVDGRVVRADDEYEAERELLAALLAAVEPHLRADHFEQAAARITEAGPQNDERPWPFALLLRQEAEQIRAGEEEALHTLLASLPVEEGP